MVVVWLQLLLFVLFYLLQKQILDLDLDVKSIRASFKTYKPINTTEHRRKYITSVLVSIETGNLT